MKKFVLTICVLLLSVSVKAYEEFDANGFTFVLYNDNDSEVTVWNCMKTDKIIVIPNSITHNGKKYPVTRIELFGTPGCSYIIIPNSVTSIADRAFADCSNLISIKIPNSVTSMGVGVFENDSNLTSIKIPNSVTVIGERLFSGCSSLTSVTIPNSVKIIGERAFANCSSLTSITIPNSVERIREGAFEGCSGLTSVIIPNSVSRTDEGIFKGVGLPYSSCKLIVGSNYYKSAHIIRYDLPTSYYYIFKGGFFTELMVDDKPTKVVDATQIETEKSIIGIYDLNGRRIDAPQKGINIIRYKDGTSKKVILK